MAELARILDPNPSAETAKVQPCSGREGRCLRQAITEEPIPWAAAPEPYTLMGNAEWADYDVSADVQVPAKGVATLMGRIDSPDTFVEETAKGPSGYVLSLEADGTWQLISRIFNKPDVVLAKGAATVQPLSWHHVELSFAGHKIGRPLMASAWLRRKTRRTRAAWWRLAHHGIKSCSTICGSRRDV